MRTWTLASAIGIVLSLSVLGTFTAAPAAASGLRVLVLPAPGSHPLTPIQKLQFLNKLAENKAASRSVPVPHSIRDARGVKVPGAPPRLLWTNGPYTPVGAVNVLDPGYGLPSHYIFSNWFQDNQRSLEIIAGAATAQPQRGLFIIIEDQRPTQTCVLPADVGIPILVAFNSAAVVSFKTTNGMTGTVAVGCRMTLAKSP